MATLVTFEGMIVVSFVAALLGLAMSLSSAGGALTVLTVTVGSLVLLSLVHSYLLIVRFSSIAEVLSTGDVDLLLKEPVPPRRIPI